MPFIEALLDAEVRLVARTGEKTCGGQSMRSLVEPMKEPPSVDLWRDQVLSATVEEEEEPEGLVDWYNKGLVKLVADKHVAAPEIYSLSLHLPATPSEIADQLEGVQVVSATGNYIVLSTGPKLCDFPSSGHYLVYDADADDLMLAPQIDWTEFKETISRRPVVVGTGDNFILVHLLMSRRTGKHCLWKWIQHAPITSFARMSADTKTTDFNIGVMVPDGLVIDKVFAYNNRVFWVDLNLGILSCFVSLYPDSFHLELLPLPEDCLMLGPAMERGRPDVYSTVDCVNGQIKVVYMDGYIEIDECPRQGQGHHNHLDPEREAVASVLGS